MEANEARNDASKSIKSAIGTDFKFREGLKTVRPKEFVRRTDSTLDAVDADDKFFASARSVLDSGVFSAIDKCTLLEKYESFRYKSEFKAKQVDAMVQMEKAQHTEKLHELIASKRRVTREVNSKRDVEISKNWVETLEMKRERQMRDLKFELATQKFAELKKESSRALHHNEQVEGIETYEANLKRCGMGGGGDDDGHTFAVSYEENGAFLSRIEEISQKNWPTNEDASDFMTQLKQRTKEKRSARYEKARRRRRLLVEQKRTATLIDSKTASITANDEARNTSETMLVLRARKEERLAEMKEIARLSKHSIQERAENMIEQFSDQCRTSDIETERKLTLDSIIALRAARLAEKRHRNEVIARSLVDDMISNLFDVGSKSVSLSPNASVTVKPNVFDVGVLMQQLIQFTRAQLKEFDGPVISMADIVALDAWTATSSLAFNVGKWSHTKMPLVNPTSAKLCTSSQQAHFESSSDTISCGEICSQPEVRAATRSDSFLEIAHSIMETIIERSSLVAATTTTVADSVVPDFSLTTEELVTYYAECTTMPKVAVIVTDGTTLPHSIWATAIEWFGYNFAFLWDSTEVIDISQKIKPFMDGKSPTLTFTSLIMVFFRDKVVCPAELTTMVLPPSVLRACTELVEISSRVMSIQIAVEANEKILPDSVPFTEATLAILVGTGLWLRNFIYEKLSEVLPNLYDVIPHFAIVAKRFRGTVKSADSSFFLRIVDWFARGGTRDNIPETESDLQGAVLSEMGMGKVTAPAKKASAAKSKGGLENQPSGKSAINLILFIRNGQIDDSSTTEVVRVDTTSIVDAILDSFAEVQVESDSEKFEDGLLNFSQSSVGLLRQAIPVLCLEKTELMKPPSIAANEVCGSTTVDVDAKPTSPISLAIPFVAEITVAEALVAAVLSCGFATTADGNYTEPSNFSALSNETFQKVTHSIKVRRDRLVLNEKMWYMHFVGQHRFDTFDIAEVHAMTSKAQAVDIELVGIILLIFELALTRVYQQQKNRDAALLSALNSVDLRWQQLCVEALPGVQGEDQCRAKVTAGDLICRLGDVVDERHMSFLQMLDRFSSEAESDWGILTEVILQISGLLCSCLFDVLEAKRQAAHVLAMLFEKAGYSSFPWFLTNSSAKGAKLRIERRRDDLRAASLMMIESCGATASNNDFLQSNQAEKWKEFSSIDLTATDSMLVAAAFNEVYVESMTTAASLLVGFKHGLESCRSALSESLIRIKMSIRLRHEYDHSILKDWGAKLSLGAHENVRPDAIFLSQVHFGFYYSSSLDKYAFFSGQGFCKTKDMHIPLHWLSILSEEIYRAGQLTESEVGLGQSADLVDKVSAQLVSAVNRAVKRDSQFPRSWKNSLNVESFAKSFIREFECSGNGSFADRSVILRSMITFLVLGTIVCAPPIDYILRLAKALNLSNVDAHPTTSVAAILQIVSKDPKLATCWWLPPDTPNSQLLTSHALACIAFCCIDHNGDVDVEDLVLELCKVPHRDTSSLVTNIMLLPAGGGPMASKDCEEEAAIKLPSFLQDGIFKALRLASELHCCDSTDADDGMALSAQQSDPANRLTAVLGSRIRQPQLKWLRQKVLGPKNIVLASGWTKASGPTVDLSSHHHALATGVTLLKSGVAASAVHVVTNCLDLLESNLKPV